MQISSIYSYRECGCGEGDSGCALCGCCRLCARDTVDNRQLAILGPDGAADLSGMMRLDLIFRDKVKDLVPPRQRAKLQEQVCYFLRELVAFLVTLSVYSFKVDWKKERAEQENQSQWQALVSKLQQN